VRIAAPVKRAFAWHAQPEALAAVIPPGAPVRNVSRTGGLEDGATVLLSIGFGRFRIQ